ncbi:MAG: bifunctional phosphoglucose/phosphomannose isomerase [Flavobacteriales bacterium]|jgi:glucose/mannose-6-phosphate isomerase|nr:bifunctional phosphoglucose/phosphomannose isomerase [Flavobacteriales bacterium]
MKKFNGKPELFMTFHVNLRATTKDRMKDIIANFSNQIREATEIGKSSDFKNCEQEINKILVCGLGGSGIGGKIISFLLKDELKVPFLTLNDYEIPAWVDKNTLVIASSYSGNTEETLTAIRSCIERESEIAVITSGGQLKQMAEENGWNANIVPGGEQPRAMLAYSLVQQMYLLKNYGLIGDETLNQLKELPQFIDDQEEIVRFQSVTLARNIAHKTLIVYTGSRFEGVGIRFKQQINENSKELCWSHVFPEMTHNELVGWAGGSEQFAPVFLSTDYDHPRTQRRWEISQEIIKKYTSNVFEVKAKGGNVLEQTFYLIHYVDWVSFYVSEIKNIDPVEVDVIGHLKSEMAKMS